VGLRRKTKRGTNHRLVGANGRVETPKGSVRLRSETINTSGEPPAPADPWKAQSWSKSGKTPGCEEEYSIVGGEGDQATPLTLGIGALDRGLSGVVQDKPARGAENWADSLFHVSPMQSDFPSICRRRSIIFDRRRCRHHRFPHQRHGI